MARPRRPLPRRAKVVGSGTVSTVKVEVLKRPIAAGFSSPGGLFVLDNKFTDIKIVRPEIVGVRGCYRRWERSYVVPDIVLKHNTARIEGRVVG
jgi:hypothetical protein